MLAPKSAADLAFIMHALSWLATNGTAADCLLSGHSLPRAEKKIRKYLIDNNYIDAVIALPDKLFPNHRHFHLALCGAQKNPSADNATLFIDATAQFVKMTKVNQLSEENIQTILGL